MKKVNNVLINLLVVNLLFFIGCTKEEDTIKSDENTLTGEILKVETSYEYGMIKNELQSSEPKLEISSNSPEFLSKIKKELENSYSKQVSYLKSAHLIGVFRDQTCGSFQELYVNMDCEDNDGQSKTSGWVGSSLRNSSKNVVLRFCVVDALDLFSGNYYSPYAILNLTAEIGGLQYVNVLKRDFDNEDHANGNYTLLNGVNISGQYGGCNFGLNTTLSFLYFPQNNGSLPMPNLGMSYGVLGQSGNPLTQGYIYTDDEDNPNWNYFYKWTWTGSGYIGMVSGNIPNIIDVGANTKLYLKKIN
jgi:hypothetical protein